MTRQLLPNRRAAENFPLHFRGQTYQVTVGFYETAADIQAGARRTVGEVFITCGKTGTDSDIFMRDCSIFASNLLQRGCCVDDLRRMVMRGEGDEPQGVMAAVLDEIGRMWP